MKAKPLTKFYYSAGYCHKDKKCICQGEYLWRWEVQNRIYLRNYKNNRMNGIEIMIQNYEKEKIQG